MPELNVYVLVAMFVGSFVITYIVLPRVIGVVTYKRLMDKPGHRCSHTKKIPSLGGIAFYIVLMLGLYFSKRYDYYNVAMDLVPGLMILFIIGLKDDLVVLAPLTKVGAELVAIMFILLNPSFHLTELHGFLGINSVSLFVSIPLSAFVMLAIINAFNLIDGIDGLAAIVGIIIFSECGFLFYKMGLYFFLCISVILIASLMAFLRFNLSSTKKIFMGDTGSLIIGFIIATMTMRLFAVNPVRLQMLPFQLENLPLVILALLIVPFFDTTRVFAVRIAKKQSPFSPDRNHIHHILIDYLHLSHRKASICIGIFNVAFALAFILLGIHVDNLWLLGIFGICIVFIVYFFYRINFSYSNLRRRLRIRKRISYITRIMDLFMMK